MPGIGIFISPLISKKRLTSNAPPSDAQLYLNAAVIPNDSTLFYASTIYERTGAQINQYVNTFFDATVVHRPKVRTLYMFCPGDSIGNSLNAISPLFTDTSFRLLYERTGTITHDGTGINIPIGAAANTKHIPYCDGYEYITGEGWTWYSATDIANVGYAMGTYSNAYYYCDASDIYLGCGSVGDRFAAFSTTFKGLNIVNRGASSARMKFFKNGSLYLERDLTWQYSGALEFLLGGTQDSSSGPNFPFIPASAPLNFGFMANHFGFTPTELTSWNIAVTNFLTSMGRI